MFQTQQKEREQKNQRDKGRDRQTDILRAHEGLDYEKSTFKIGRRQYTRKMLSKKCNINSFCNLWLLVSYHIF